MGEENRSLLEEEIKAEIKTLGISRIRKSGAYHSSG